MWKTSSFVTNACSTSASVAPMISADATSAAASGYRPWRQRLLFSDISSAQPPTPRKLVHWDRRVAQTRDSWVRTFIVRPGMMGRMMESRSTSRKPVIVFGHGNLAKLIHALGQETGLLDIAAFTVEQSYIDMPLFCDRPVVPFERCQDCYPPTEYELLVATGPSHINRNRRRYLNAAVAKGYRIGRFIHPTAQVASGVALGVNCVVLPGVIIEPFCRVGANCVFWSGSLVAHHTTIDDDCFFAPRAAVSGCCRIGRGCFLGTNCTVRDHVTVAPETIVGAGVAIRKDTLPGGVYSQQSPEAHRIDSHKVSL